METKKEVLSDKNKEKTSEESKPKSVIISMSGITE